MAKKGVINQINAQLSIKIYYHKMNQDAATYDHRCR